MANEFVARKGIVSLGNIQVSGSISATGAITITGSIASSSYASNSERLDNLDSTSFVFTSSYNPASSSFSTRVTNIEGNYATTGSNIFTGAQTVCANITSTGTIIAQTLNVQQVTSSIVYSSGSNTFGCQLTDVQQFTGSVLITGSLVVTTTAPELTVGATGVTLGNVITDIHNITGSLRTTGSITGVGNACFTSVCSPSYTGGTFSGTTAYASTVACSPVGCFTTSCASSFIGGTVSGTTGTFSSNVVATGSLIVAPSNNVELQVQSTGVTIGNALTDSHQISGSLSTTGSVLAFSPLLRVCVCSLDASTSITSYTSLQPSGFDFNTSCASGNRAIRIYATNTLAASPNGAAIQFFSSDHSSFPGQFYMDSGANNNAALIFRTAATSGNITERMRITSAGIACFACQVCAPSLSIPGCIINTTDGGIFLKHCINDKNFWVWQEHSCNWGQFSANCNSQVSALGGLFAGSGLVTFFTNYNAGGGIGLSSLAGAGNACGVIGFDHNSGNAYFAGCVAIGTTCAMDTLTVGNNGGLILQRFSGATTYSSDLYFYGTRGTQASPTAKLNNDVAMGIRPRAYDGSSYLDVASIESKLEGVTATNVMFGNLIFSTNNGGTTLTERLRITPGGNVGIGTGAPEGRLHIQGCTSGYGANLVLLNFCNATGASTGIDFGVDASSAGCGNGNAQIKVCNIGGPGGSNCSDMIFSLWNGTAFCERLRIRDKGTILIDTGNNASQASTSSPVALRFNNDYSSGYTDASLKVYLFNSGATIQGFTAGPQYDLQYHSSGNADARHSLYTENAIRLMVKSDAICAFQPIYSACDYKAHTFCLFSATSIPCKTFTVSANTTGCFSVTDFSGIPSRARAVLVYGWYNINGDGLAGQADHAVSWFGVQNSTSLQTWGTPVNPWPGSTSTFHNCNFGTFVMEHDGDSSAAGMTNGMHYYGSWHQGIVGVDSGGCIKYNVAHGISAGTHYNGLYAVGYWL